MNLFVTGFPGFIARSLVPKLIQARPFEHVNLLVEQRFAPAAREAAAKLTPDASVEVAVGDITRERMGIADSSLWSRLMEDETEWWHLAAVYRLEVGLELARRINVEGTRNVLAAARQAKKLSRFNYVSTAYVAGLQTGVFKEDDLPRPKPENFKNFYELTKNEAEWLVRAEMLELPTTIYRYGVVTGDSKTGATEKFDGPFFTIKYFDNYGHLPLPMIGDMKATINVVPVDFAVDATVAISGQAATVGKCFHVVDPDPITTLELFQRIAAALGRKPPRWKIPPWIMDKLMAWKWFRRRIAIPKEAMVYINHPVTYDAANTLEALKGTGLRCPSPREYIPRLVEFYLKNKERRELHLKVD